MKYPTFVFALVVATFLATFLAETVAEESKRHKAACTSPGSDPTKENCSRNSGPTEEGKKKWYWNGKEKKCKQIGEDCFSGYWKPIFDSKEACEKSCKNNN